MCEACNGELILLGSLGKREWFRCRDCGVDQSRTVVATIKEIVEQDQELLDRLDGDTEQYGADWRDEAVVERRADQ